MSVEAACIYNLSIPENVLNVIAGAAEAEQLIQTLPEEENLYILTAGEMPPNPAQLLSSGKMKELMLQFQTQFDLVII